jgi:hypothetical protein
MKILLILLGLLLLILVIGLAASTIANLRFRRTVAAEFQTLFANADHAAEIVRAADLNRLPPPVRKWLTASGIVERRRISTVHLLQSGAMRPSPRGARMPLNAEQEFSVNPPAFIWYANIHAAPFLSLVARDKYQDGHGNMLIKIGGLYKLADDRGPEMDQGTLLRFLAETIWFPSAVLNNYIQWDAGDSTSARATMTFGGVTASGIFRFNDRGDVISFEALRYRGAHGKYSLEPWLITMSDYRTVDGIRIPHSCEVAWKHNSDNSPWLKLEIKTLEFDAPSAHAR